MSTTHTFLAAFVRTDASIIVLSTFLVVSVVGYVLALAYFRNLFKKIVKTIRAEKNEMRNHINNLNQQQKKLTVNLNEKEKEIERLTVKINKLKSLSEEAIHEQDELLLENIGNAQPQLKKSNGTLSHK